MYEYLLWATLVTATVYHPVPEQTNSEYWITASGKEIDTLNPIKHRWIAVSRDLESHGYTMGSEVMVSGADQYNGVWTIQDRMNKRWSKRIDFLIGLEDRQGKWNNVKIRLIR